MGQFTKVSFHVLNTGLGFDSILSDWSLVSNLYGFSSQQLSI